MNKQQRKAVLNAILTPFSWLFGAGVWIRNMAFNWGILKQESFDVPVVSVGNITVGGTGKTPHAEYIIEALCRKYRIGVLSRGYKRKTHGFILATDSLSPKDIGDEPYQIFHKFNGSLFSSLHKTPSFDTLAQILCDICSSILCVLNSVRR